MYSGVISERDLLSDLSFTPYQIFWLIYYCFAWTWTSHMTKIWQQSVKLGGIFVITVFRTHKHSDATKDGRVTWF